MFQSYLLIALRSLKKQKFYAFLNIAGLALGVTCCLLITLYVIDELSYDRFHAKADRIYRVDSDIKFGGNDMKLAVNSDPMGFTLVKDYPQVEQAVRFRDRGSFLVKKGEQNIKEERVIFTDSTLFDVFSFPMLMGNPKTALAQPKSVVISESIAHKYFGGVPQAMNQVLRFKDYKDLDCKVTGVIRDMPTNSHIRYDFLLPMLDLEESKAGNWVSHNFNTYIVLKAGADPKQLEAQFPTIIRKYIGPVVKQLMNINSVEEFEKTGNYVRYSLTPLTSIHLHSERVAELAPNGNIQYVYIFSAIALFILVIACINFMNLATARSSGRAKEVGVRKVLGSLRSSLVGQFLTESVVMSTLAFTLAVAGAYLLMPLFNQLANKELHIPLLSSFWMLPCLLASALLVGLLAGSYPAFFLSAFQPISVLKGQLATNRGASLRRGLVIFQFCTSIFLIIGTIIVYKQLNFIRSRDLGFDKEQVLVVSDAYALGNQLETFKNESARNPGVVQATVTGYLPVQPAWRNDMPYFPEGVIQQEKAVSMQSWQVDHDYVSTLGMQIKQGRNFSRDFLTDSSGVIINEAAARLFGYSDPVGRKIMTYKDIKTGEIITYTVLGVVKDFNFESLRQNIGALCMTLGKSTGAISFRLKTENVSQVVGAMEKQWKKMAPGQPFNYSFMNDQFDAMYHAEQRVGQIAVSFAVLAILIACLGLFGLSAFTAEQRTKEIGIRKVLGASVGNLVTLLSKDFLKLVLLANILAWPLAWWAMSRWLQDFAYRIDISWWIFGLSGVVAILIAVLTISFQAIKAALANPVKSLRTE